MCNFFILSVILNFLFIAFANAGSCGTFLETGVSEKDKAIIVNTHNNLRSLIAQGKVPGQPKGKNFKTISWDNYLAQEAQKIANTCVFKHVAVKDARFSVGQNLYAWWGTGKSNGTDWKKIIESLFSEYKKFSYSPKFVFNPSAGHYTQIVWANTYLVGCGYVYFEDSGGYNKLNVCNYGPAGNVIGATMYELA